MWLYFKSIKVITITGKDTSTLKESFQKAGIANYDIRVFVPSPGKKNSGADDLSTMDIIRHTHCDEKCKNIRNSHMTVIREAYDSGAANVLVFEDDADFDFPFDYSRLKEIVEWLQANEWDAFFFGNCPWPPVSFPVSKGIVRVMYPMLAHAYAMTRSGMEKFFQTANDNPELQIDKLFAIASMKKYAAYPSFCFQNIDPALYTRAAENLHLPFEFRTVCTFIERLAVILPIILGILIIVVIARLIKWVLDHRGRV